jgi:putative DNA methylase
MAERRKKLIEVALPLEAINKESAREKSIRHGHPSTLHLWWARRPLAACRAVLFAQFVDDPDSDPAYRRADGSVDEDAAGLKRAQLFNLIEELVKWENSNNDRIINAARAEIARCVASRLIEEGELGKETIIQGKDEGKPHPKGPLSGEFRTAWELIVYGHGNLDALSRRTIRLCPPEVINHFLATYAPPVLDPFAGGGSIPLEAQRLGLRAYASDLNPVAVLINKALIEIPPKFANQPPVNLESQKMLKTARYRGAEGLAEDVRYYGKWMRDEAERRIGHLYPRVKITNEMVEDRPDLKHNVGQELTVIAWLWARTVSCPNPACRVTFPLVKSFALCTKSSRPRRLVPALDTESSRITFSIAPTKSSAREGTVSRSGAVCPACKTSIPFTYVRTQGCSGLLGTQLLAIIGDGRNGREYFAADETHKLAAHSAQPTWSPTATIPHNPFSLRPPLYGYNTFASLFTDRQLVAMNQFCELAEEVRGAISAVANPDYAAALSTYLAMNVSRLANRCSTGCFWDPKGENVQQVFARQAIAMTWDFVEANPLGNATGSFANQLNYLANVIERLPDNPARAAAEQRSAEHLSAVGQPVLISTDPPYYDNIDYADLSDYFYVWLRRILGDLYPELFTTVLVPKSEELVATPYRFDGDREAANDHFRNGLASVLQAVCHQNVDDSPAGIIYAFKQQEQNEASDRASTGWETFLQGVVDAGFEVTGTWPLRTELIGNLKVHMNVLASSVVLACRRRRDAAELSTHRAFLASLRRELTNAMRQLQRGGIAPVDLAQAAIGPGMGVFSRYSKVIESDGEAMTVRAALTLINQVLDEVLAEQEGEFDGDTRWAVAWFEQHGVQEGPYGVAETLSKAKNTSVQGLVDAGLITARSGKVKLLARDEMPEDWDPIADTRSTCWEATQHLIRRLQNEGEQSAGELLARLGGDYGDLARDLAYRLYSICERKGWAQEALAYNSLVIAWNEISKLSRSQSIKVQEPEKGLF